MHIFQTSDLIDYLRRQGHLAAEEPVRCTMLAGGVSCHTFRITRQQGADLVVKQAREQLAVADTWKSDPSRIHVEAKAMRTFNALLPSGSVPAFVFEDHTHHLLGMEAVPHPHHNWKAQLMAGEVDPGMAIQLGQLLGMLHGRSHAQEELSQAFADQHFFETLRLEPYYEFSALRVPEAASFLGALVQATRTVRATLVHGDYSPKNLLVYEGSFVLLDHEVTHYGDGAFDIGFSMTHLLSKAHHLPAHRAELLQLARDYWATYRVHFEPPPGWEARAVRHTLACLLARVRGKSPLEYLHETEQRHQLAFCLETMAHPPERIPKLIQRAADWLATI